jgi:tetratricopeptide (TPR) repeat protein
VRRRAAALAPILSALGLALALAALPRAAAADPWYVHHDNARRALETGDWRRAVEEINQAIERRGDSGIRVRTYGMRVADYLPYLTLGIAYYRLGHHDAALEAFDTEERLGVVQGSEEALAELERYRGLAAAARDEAGAGEQRRAAEQRAAEILAGSLTEARDLERRGLLDEAMAALARGLAVAPEDAEATALMAGLRERAAARERERREEREAADDLARAREHLERGEPRPAAALLRRVLGIQASDEARRLLDRAQQAIVAEVEEEHRGEQAAEALAGARRLGGEGRTEEALERLEVALALAPGDAEAAALRARLIAERDAARAEAELTETLEAAEGHLAAGRFEVALAAANRALALERGNPRALEVVRRGYAEISRRLLATGAGESVPPAIRFADRRLERDGELAERVDDPDFRLTGVAIDGTPVTIAIEDAGAGTSGGGEVAATTASQPIGDYFVTEFAATLRLPAGRTVLAVTATDAGGLSARSEYVVIYRRPWFLAPWAWAAAAGVPLLVAGALLTARARRRRRLRRRRFNPYIAGGPVFDEALFYGRERLIQRVLETVHTNSLLLHGERRIGKTSILHQLRRRLEALDDPEYRFHPVYVDLQGTPEERFFATLADQVFETLGPPAADPGATPRAPALARPGYDHHDLMRELQGLIRELQAASAERIKVVLLIDEVDELNDYDPRVNQRLRSLFMKRFAESLAAVVAGVRIRREWEREASPWYNFFEEIEVEAIAPEAARELVLGPIRGVFRVEAGAAERIVEAAGGKPYAIQRRCLALVNRLHEQNRRTITLADVEAVEGEGGW